MRPAFRSSCCWCPFTCVTNAEGISTYIKLPSAFVTQVNGHCCCSCPVHHQSTPSSHRRPPTPTILHVSSQHRSQVGQSHSILLSPRRGWVTPHRHRIGEPAETFRSRRSIACRCPASGNQMNGWDAGYGACAIGNGDTPFRWPGQWRSGNRRGWLPTETESLHLSDFGKQSRTCSTGRGKTASTRHTPAAHHLLRVLGGQRQRPYQLINHPRLHNRFPCEWRLNRHPYLAPSCCDNHRGNCPTATLDGNFSLHNP